MTNILSNSVFVCVACLCVAISASGQLYPTPGRDLTAPPPRKPHDTTPPPPPPGSGPSDYQIKESIIKRNATLISAKETLYRKPTAEEMASIAVSGDDLKGYEEILRKDISGVIRLIADQECDQQIRIPQPDSTCAKYSMPGNGSSYSFREGRYRIPRLADLRYLDKDMLRVGSRFTMGILGQLDETDLRSVTLDSDIVKQVASLRAPENMGQIERLYYKLDKGMVLGGHVFSNFLPLNPGAIYALRSIAFRGPNPQTFQGITYDESEFDRRIDMLVVFKVTRKANDGSLIIFWKALRTQTSPKLAEKRE